MNTSTRRMFLLSKESLRKIKLCLSYLLPLDPYKYYDYRHVLAEEIIKNLEESIESSKKQDTKEQDTKKIQNIIALEHTLRQKELIDSIALKLYLLEACRLRITPEVLKKQKTLERIMREINEDAQTIINAMIDMGSHVNSTLVEGFAKDLLEDMFKLMDENPSKDIIFREKLEEIKNELIERWRKLRFSFTEKKEYLAALKDLSKLRVVPTDHKNLMIVNCCGVDYLIEKDDTPLFVYFTENKRFPLHGVIKIFGEFIGKVEENYYLYVPPTGLLSLSSDPFIYIKKMVGYELGVAAPLPRPSRILYYRMPYDDEEIKPMMLNGKKTYLVLFNLEH